MFELHKRYTVKMPVGTITESGIREIARFIEAQRLNEGDWKERNPETTRVYLIPLPDTWDYQWVITGRGEYVGTFPKRVSKYYWQTYQLRCPNSFVAELGQIARQHSSDESSYIIDFTDRLDWDAGDFGDSGSCFWGSNSLGLEAMQHHGVMAVRFYDAKGRGYGRAWLDKHWNHKDLWILWNGYGLNAGTIAVARVLAQLWGVSYKKIGLHNNGTASGLVYVNGATGFVIGQADKLTNISRYDLSIEAVRTCDSCGYEVHEDETYVTPDGEDYCQECFYEYYDNCPYCGDVYWRDDMTYTEPHDELVCDGCLDRLYSRCVGCERYWRNGDIHRHKKRNYCQGCLRK